MIDMKLTLKQFKLIAGIIAHTKASCPWSTQDKAVLDQLQLLFPESTAKKMRKKPVSAAAIETTKPAYTFHTVPVVKYAKDVVVGDMVLLPGCTSGYAYKLTTFDKVMEVSVEDHIVRIHTESDSRHRFGNEHKHDDLMLVISGIPEVEATCRRR